MFYSEPISAAAGGTDCSLYFPVSNSFDDGSDDVPVAAMVPSPATLTVFKSGTGGIFVHSPKNGAYPCISGAAATGTAARGGAVFFAGYPTFVTARGVMRLSGSSNSYERRAESLSADRPDIAELLSSYADECSLCVFGDRLVLCGRGEIYITDPYTLQRWATNIFRYGLRAVTSFAGAHWEAIGRQRSTRPIFIRHRMKTARMRRLSLSNLRVWLS